MVSIFQILPVRPYPYITQHLPQSQIYNPIIQLQRGCKIIKDSGFVFLWKFILRIAAYFIEYLTSMHVFPMAPSPTMTNLMGTGYDYIAFRINNHPIDSH